MIRLDGVSVAFELPGGATLHALRELDLTLEPGQSTVVVGSNGAGKSTALNVLAGTVHPTRGRVVIDDRDVTRLPEQRRARWIARVFADPAAGTADTLTIEENLALALARGRRRGLGPALDRRVRSRARDALAVVGLGLEDRLGTPARLLSSGQRQCLTVVMATLRAPRLLLLDEHVANLDPRTQALVLELSERVIRDRALTALTVTHDVGHALAFGDRLIALHAGRIVLDADGDAKRALRPTDVAAVYRAPDAADAADAPSTSPISPSTPSSTPPTNLPSPLRRDAALASD